MRLMMVVIGLAAGVAFSPNGAAAATTKMGCEIGSQVWDASEGKCVPGTHKYAKRAPEKPAPKAQTPKKKPQ